MALPLFEIKLSKKPIGIIKLGDRNLKFIRINKTDAKQSGVAEVLKNSIKVDFSHQFQMTQT